MNKKIRDAEVALAFSVDAHFVRPAKGLNIGGRNKDIWSYKEADLGDGSPRGNSYQTIKEFDILHHGDLTQNPVHLWAKFKSFGF